MASVVDLGLAALALGLVLNPLNEPLITIAGFSIAVYLVDGHMVPAAAPALAKIGLCGRDRLKPKQNHAVPESLGSVIGVTFIFAVLLFTPFTLRMNALAAYLSGILSIQSMIMLGFADDLFDLRWRHKFFLPAIAAVPMLIVYYIEYGNTHILLPPFLNLGTSIDLGWLYYAYMAALTIFATNCINIYAGINGLEVGQSVIVALGIIANDLIYLARPYFGHALSPETARPHMLSLFFMLPLLGGSIALLRANWFPASVFVGDTYCYFAGMVFAVAGILGHYSKTMLSLILPQILNFIYSVPQLLHIVPCPRHRMPLLDPETHKLLPSRADVTELPGWKLAILRLLAKLQLIKMWESSTEGPHGKTLIEVSNMTLINLVLVHAGPLKENELAKVLLFIQAISGATALVARHMLAKMIFGRDNL